MRLAQRDALLKRKRAWQEAGLMELPPLPPKAQFKAKFGLPALPSYKGHLKASYWAKWKSKKPTRNFRGKSWVSAEGMKALARKAGNRNMHLVDRVARRLVDGADIGVGGRGRLPTRGRILRLPTRMVPLFLTPCKRVSLMGI